MKTIYGNYNKKLWITKGQPRFYRWIRFYQAEKDGGLVLADEGHWTKINGLGVRFKSYEVHWIFRRQLP